MGRPTRQKQPGEARTLSFDFTDKLASGDSLTGTATVTVASGLTAGTPSRTGNVVSVRLSSGTDGTDYNVQCSCATTDGDTLHLDATIEVREAAN